jgi:uncharacterized surface protein with fasciclin (FAS1) repeats
MLLIGIWGCKKEASFFDTIGEPNMTGYLDKYPEKFSEWKKVLELTGNASFLNAYGAYTMFAPTNDAIKIYLQEKNVTSVDQLDLAELKNMVRFHILSDTIRSTAFTDGKLATLTMYGQYLITGSKNVDGITTTTVNRQANLIQSDIAVGNGIIHVIDHVLQPAKFSVAQLIENNPKYTIFTQALKETGLYDTLNILPKDNPVGKMMFLTALAESDSVLKVAGINSYADLKAQYSKSDDFKSVLNGLHSFMAYHIIYDAKYLSDIASAQAQTTLAPLEIISTQLTGQTILINDVTFLGIHEPGSPINRAASDNSATNGVLNDVFVHYDIKVRKPVRVDWDVCDFPEMRKLTAYYKKKAYSFSMTTGQPIKDWFMPGPFGLNYAYNSSGSSSAVVNGDYLEIPLGAPNRSPYLDMKTPLIVRGKYKLWIGYRSTGGTIVSILVDGVAMPKILNFKTNLPSGTPEERESQGWKQYTSSTSGVYASMLLGVIDIQTTDRHTLRIQNISGTGNTNWVDFIQFIPVADDQIYPRFNIDGSLILRPVI